MCITKVKGHCDRCGQKASVTIMSKFDEDMICMPCKKEEKAHPDYQRASDEELKACQSGNLNFEGIGLPEDLKLKYTKPLEEKLIHSIFSSETDEELKREFEGEN